MKKDIEIPIVKNVHIVIIHEWNEEFLDKDWNVYIVNNRTTGIEMTMVVSKGYDGDRKTSIMRHSIGDIEAKSFKKVEVVQDDVLALNNEFFVTFYDDNKLYEKRFVFEKNTIVEKNLVRIPLMRKEGIYAN
ncbi:hypothetical protein [Maribacter hydrothermalis]|uniref:Phenylalanyl-tRNA synthetase subunit alpha n=1 Tax=Maribacter hydrothermalis TaxID=1836467 RepID=A0A1B7Z421_9FLAO|nr:hypothetical protein [Maribacter hydrothermalis]APQ17184.1 hypothetical protein BTR34_07515 [Maribacter hydrothermalis]OBR37444.1 hypothetical protein A9200_07265 [Maribacter hydrothermalis]